MSQVDFTSVVTRLQDTVVNGGPMWTMVTGICWLLGVIIGYFGLMQLKEVGEQRRHTYAGPIMSFIAASLMLALPEIISSFLMTTYAAEWGANPLSMVKDKDGGNKSFYAVMTLVSFIGYVFFIRGIIILKEAGEPQRHPNSTITRAIIVMASGMAAIYIDQTLKMLGNTFGFSLDTYLN